MADASRQLPAPVAGTALTRLPGIGVARDALVAAWETRESLLPAWAVLRHGVCTSCSFGSRGLQHDDLPGPHLCPQGLRDLPKRTQGPLLPVDLLSVQRLRGLSELEALGRLPTPFVRRGGERGFRRVDWAHAIRVAGEVLREATGVTLGPDVTLETGFAAARLAKLLDVPCAVPGLGGWMWARQEGPRPSRFERLLEADLILVWDGDLEQAEPMLVRWLGAARRRGARVVALHEGGLPSWVLASRVADDRMVARDLDALVGCIRHQRALLGGPEAPEGDLGRAGVRPSEAAWLARLLQGAKRPVSVCRRMPAGMASLGHDVVVLEPAANAAGLHALGLGAGSAGNVAVRSPAEGDHRLYLDGHLRPDMLHDTELTVILPLQSLYEGGGLVTSGELRVRYSPAVLEPMAESGLGWRVLQELAREHDRAGWDALPWDDARGLCQDLGARHPAFAGLERLDREGDWQWLVEEA